MDDIQLQELCENEDSDSMEDSDDYYSDADNENNENAEVR